MNALISSDFTLAEDPLILFQNWFAEAKASEPNDPDAMALSSVDDEGLPDSRMVLCRTVNAAGFAFFTNVESAKGRELSAHPKAAGLFHWKSLRRQVRLRGRVERVGEEETAAYFQSRARISRIGAWASQQSRPLESRAMLEAKVAELTEKFGDGDIALPPFWRGFRIVPHEMEFWRDGAYRLHDRVAFARTSLSAPWSRQRLYP